MDDVHADPRAWLDLAAAKPNRHRGVGWPTLAFVPRSVKIISRESIVRLQMAQSRPARYTPPGGFGVIGGRGGAG